MIADILRIRNGDVCYWPNLGYGRFGKKVTMDNAPWFDAPDQFDQKLQSYGTALGHDETLVLEDSEERVEFRTQRPRVFFSTLATSTGLGGTT